MDRHVVLDWYNNLDARVVDLVGDFVGDELFIIEGDSLLLQCFSNEKLDFDPGFQVLHATYLAEKLLQKLQQRKCFFEVVFFAENAPLCIPRGVPSDLHARYLLAREAIIQHLVSVRVQPSRFFQALRFDNFQSDEFKAHLINSGTYLFMCHDGASFDQNDDGTASDIDSSDSESDSDCSDLEDNDQEGSFVDKRGEISRFKLRAMIYWFVVHGYNLALLNSLEFRDTKVMAMVIESSIKTNPLSTGPETEGPNQLWDSLSQLEIEDSQDQAEDALEHDFVNNQSSNHAQTDKFFEQALLEKPDLSQRQCLVVATLSSMLLGGAVDNLENKIGAQSMILHIVLLQNTQLSDRSIQTIAPENLKFFNEFVKTAKALLTSELWEKAISENNLPCDLSDLMDGTLFFEVQRMVEKLGIQAVISSVTQSPFNTLACLVDHICGTTLQCEAIGGAGPTSKDTTHGSISKPHHGFEKVLPFSNAVFDKILKPVHVAVDASADAKSDSQISKEFKEDSHWHNSKTHDQKKVILTPQEVERSHKRNQRFMAEMRDYAASLSGSQPEPIIVESSSTSRQKSHQTPSASRDVGTRSTTSKSDKKAHSKSGKPSTKEMATAFVHQKAMEVTQKQRQKWKNMYNDEFALIDDLVTRFTRLNGYLTSLPKDSRQVLEPEILTCMIDTLLRLIFAERTNVQSKKHMLIVTRIWKIVTSLVKIKQGISSDIVTHVSTVCQVLGLPDAPLHADIEQKLSFPSFKIPKAAPSMSIEMSPVQFQLLHGGPFMERSIDSLPDSRTPDFAPDRWQREVLDQIDAKKSAFIVAPTSAGKTFISFYAMRQILKEDHDGILVYVAPTKALVNQIAAEVQARFSKAFPAKTSGKSVWAIHTRDYRINNPQGCQILITVPQILQTMLLNPSNANAWTPRLRRIIFDEIHCIGQADDGVVWEQLLLMSPCPIIALSATVGNPQEFYNWLDFAQRTNGFDLKMIQHQHRYSDLRKYVYQPHGDFSFKGFSNTPSLARLGLDEADDMTFVHPVTSLLDRTRSIPDDLDFEPRDCFTLWKAMKDLQTEQFPVDPSLDPSIFFSNTIIQKVHVIEWQRQLKTLLGDWMKDRGSPFETLLLNLEHPTGFVVQKEKDLSKQVSRMNGLSDDTLDGNLLDTTLPLISSLHAQNALPALFFNYDRGRCEDICHDLLTQLQNAETKWKEESPVWKSKVAKWEVWKTSKMSAKKKLEKATKKKTSGNADEEPTSKAEQAKDSASTDFGWLDLFDPKRPVDGFHLADFKKVPASEFLVYAKQLQWRSVPQWLIDALERGIGVHHAGMNRKYRQVCEILFRKGFLRVVIATGTLALGINMPCKTVVFSGDSIFLTALNFRQAAGRAGRRGFDVLGNVVFQQVPPSKVQRLMSSRLPSLNGHFPITTSLVLRLFILLHGSKQAPSAVKSINSILSSSRIHLGGPEMKQTVLHHLRFSIEYLRRNSLLGGTGMALNFAGCISHLYYTENSSFAFHALLNSGYLQELCQDIETKPKKTVHTLMLVMAHLFGRIPLRASTLERFQNVEKNPSSIVALPPLPRKAASALRAHNRQVLDVYTGYVSTFVKQHIKEPDCSLPFSGIKCGGESSSEELGFSQFDHISPSIISPFFALSGNGDQCSTIFELSQMVRSGVWIEDSVIPYVAIDPNENAGPLNAYLYDFFKHGNVSQLETANRIRRGDVWFVLNDFSLTLATIKTSIEGFLKPGGNIGADMLDVAGGGDDYENLVDDKAVDQIEAENAGNMGVKPDNKQAVASAPVPAPRPRAKKVVMDSWEDEMDDEDDETDVEAIDASKDMTNGVGSKTMQEKPVDKSHRSMFLVAKAFNELHSEFDTKFKAMWA